MQANVSPNNASAFSPTKLPNINIPFFDDKNLSEYKPFIDLFETVVDKNRNLSDVENRLSKIFPLQVQRCIPELQLTCRIFQVFQFHLLVCGC